MNIVELFSGSGIISQEFKRAGHDTFSIDIRRRKGICMPDLKANILDTSSHDIPFRKCHVLWASPPCDVWSYAAGSFHWTKNNLPRTKKCLEHLHILEKCMAIIEELSPEYFFIENPRGRLRHYPRMLKFLKKHHAVTKELTLSSYGFITTKPTNIFTNAVDYSPKELHKFGRGAKVRHRFDNLTKCQRQRIPQQLATEIRQYCENKLPGTLID